ncbi:DMT family transporter [Spongiactinospora sp. TRM90649]|uniref:DMT family transporter n=1 Tax=Spongiactinospora sp. TRM90649 TaxID=3031114 RepID=UPI0023F9462A|nr:DMT family transporter [Spongiactinospora sp. TRM90649]MDF5752757.1 DMT family transporter [Spongiactinospora sp. TRM90649]
MTVVAAGVALLGALFFALGAALQQLEAVRTAEVGLLRLARRPRWLLGGLSITTGGALHIVALTLGPLTVVQPMGVASLLFALPISAALIGRRPARAELTAAATVSAGLIGLVLIVPPAWDTPTLTGKGTFTLLSVAGIAALVLWAGSRTATPSLRASLLAAGSGVLYGATATLTRVLVQGTWEFWLIALIPLPAILALMLLQRAYSVGHFGVSFASLQVTDPLTAVVFGALLLGEPLPAGPGGAAVAVAAAALAGIGTFALARTTPLSH